MVIIFLTCLILSNSALIQDSQPKEYECLTCDGIHKDQDYVIIYKKNRYYLCSHECFETFKKLERQGKLDLITTKIEPRSALFHDDSNPKKELEITYFYIAIYIILGLLCGGIASYCGVHKGLNPWQAFLFGFFLNIIGLFIVLLMPRCEMLFTSAGLTKIPKTRAEQHCACGHSNHPSAKKCSSCQNPLTPIAPSELE